MPSSLNSVQKKNKSLSDRSAAIGCLAEIISGMKGAVTPQTEPLYQLFYQALADEEAEPITVDVDGTKHELTPEDAGLAYDYEGSLDGLTGFSINPVDLYHQAAGGIDRDIEVTVDEDEVAETDARRPKHGHVLL